MTKKGFAAVPKGGCSGTAALLLTHLLNSTKKKKNEKITEERKMAELEKLRFPRGEN